ncbi:RNA polymerase sigma-70 factor [Chitinophaga silvatica]|uniref:RNA polymerase sigma-70 factor n=1 Tax=Chitinophaga silvatica TaxID=2282649 RepID=UPI00131404CC|nr:RNA polymerase sigma-70 factor [Chitinophaga silvatica]
MNIVNKYNLLGEAQIVGLLKSGDIQAFEAIYLQYWPKLYGYVYNRTSSKDVAEEIVQEVFYALWQKHEKLELTHTLSAYLFAAIRYQLLNYIRNSKARKTYATDFYEYREQLADNSIEDGIEVYDLKQAVEKEISRLPLKCQQIFRMSRQDHLSIQDIANVLNISHKTVENQLTKALRQLRAALRHQFHWLLLFCTELKNFF